MYSFKLFKTIVNIITFIGSIVAFNLFLKWYLNQIHINLTMYVFLVLNTLWIFYMGKMLTYER